MARKNLRVASWMVAVMLAPVVALASLSAFAAKPGRGSAAPFSVDAQVALASVVALGDASLTKMADSLAVVAVSDQARTADWKNIEPLLREVGAVNAPALNWFALPDGSYWSVQNGREKESLSERPYFPQVVGGKTIVGTLVVSKATGKSVAIVAVPVKARDGKVVGVLGASMYLEKLSEQIQKQLNLGRDLIFFSFDSQPLVALVWDPGLIFTNPKQLGPDVDRAFSEMLTKQEGTVTYVFRDRPRTVIFRKSPVTGWWYGFGLVGQAPKH